MTVDDGTEDGVRLRARDVEDLPVIASLLQDAIVPLGDIAYIKDEKSFVMVLNRFRWEEEARGGAPERVHAGLRFDRVERVQYRDIDTRDRGQFLSLLTIAHADGVVSLHFADGGAIRLEVGGLACALEDLGEAWPTRSVPRHAPD